MGEEDLCRIPWDSTIHGSNDNGFPCHKGNEQGSVSKRWGPDPGWRVGRFPRGSISTVET